MSLTGFVILSSILFAIGLTGVLTRRNIISVLISVELMLNASNIALVAFSHFVKGAAVKGDAFALFVMVIAAAEVTVGLALALTLYRSSGHSDIDALRELKG